VRLLFAALLLVPAAAPAQQDPAAQRAVIERDRQSAEFARPELRDFHLRKDMQHLPPRPDERQAEERERNAQSVATDNAVKAPDYSPLPLPGGPGHGVNVIPLQGRGG